MSGRGLRAACTNTIDGMPILGAGSLVGTSGSLALLLAFLLIITARFARTFTSHARAAVTVGAVSTNFTTTVQLDALAMSGDTEAFASAAGTAGHAGEGTWAAGAIAARECSAGAGKIAVAIVAAGVFAGRSMTVEVDLAEFLAKILELIDGGRLVVGLADLSAGVGLGWLWVLDSAWAQGTTNWDINGVAFVGVGVFSVVTALVSLRRRLGAACLAIGTGNIEDVQLAAGSGLDDVFLGWVVRDVVAVHAVVVPVAATELEGVGALKAEGTFPRAWLGIAGLDGREWELVLVVVP